MKPISEIVAENKWNCQIIPCHDPLLKQFVKGFHLKFPSNRVVSVQVGPMNYCTNRDWEGAYMEAAYRRHKPSAHDLVYIPADWWDAAHNCEMATWVHISDDVRTSLQYAFGNGGSVAGHCTEEYIIMFINRITKLDSESPKGVADAANISAFLGFDDDYDEEWHR